MISFQTVDLSNLTPLNKRIFFLKCSAQAEWNQVKFGITLFAINMAVYILESPALHHEIIHLIPYSLDTCNSGC